MKGVEPFYGDDWAFMGQYAWANHEVGRMAEGLELAERSLDLKPDNAVAVHSVAHVYYELSRDEEGSRFLGGWLDDFDRRATYRVHLSWHPGAVRIGQRPIQPGARMVRERHPPVGPGPPVRRLGRQCVIDLADAYL